MDKKIFNHYVSKVLTYRDQKKERPSPVLKVMDEYFSHYCDLSSFFELKNISKSHVIGLWGSLSHIYESKSQLGFLSPSFEKLTRNLAVNISKELNITNFSKVQLIQWWLEITILGTLAILTIGQPKKSEENNAEFADELLVTLLFYSEYPALLFFKMAEGLELSTKEQTFFIATLELFMMLVAIFALRKEKQTLDENIMDELWNKLSKNLHIVVESLRDSSNKNILPFFEQFLVALEKKEIDPMLQILLDLFDEMQFSLEEIQKDIHEIKKIINKLLETYKASKSTKMNMVHLVG